MNKQTKILSAVSVLVAIMAFYGGMKYGQTSGTSAQGGGGNFQNMTPEQRAQFGQGRGVRGMGGTGGANGFNAGGFSNGEIISKDDRSITVKLRDGGSKIIFLSGTTEVSAFTAATTDALEIGKTVMVNGKANSDGSVTAQSIQVRPAFAAATQGATTSSAASSSSTDRL